MTLIWGSNFTAIKYSLEDLLPLSFNALRFTLASIVLLIVALLSRDGFKLAPGDGWRLFLLGLLGNTFYQSLFITGMAHTRAGNAALILATTPLFTAILGRIRKHEYFTRRGVGGLLLAFAGIVTIVITGRGEVSIGETLLGDSLLLASTRRKANAWEACRSSRDFRRDLSGASRDDRCRARRCDRRRVRGSLTRTREELVS